MDESLPIEELFKQKNKGTPVPSSISPNNRKKWSSDLSSKKRNNLSNKFSKSPLNAKSKTKKTSRIKVKPKPEWNPYLTDEARYKLTKAQVLEKKKSYVSPHINPLYSTSPQQVRVLNQHLGSKSSIPINLHQSSSSSSPHYFEEYGDKNDFPFDFHDQADVLIEKEIEEVEESLYHNFSKHAQQEREVQLSKRIGRSPMKKKHMLKINSPTTTVSLENRPKWAMRATNSRNPSFLKPSPLKNNSTMNEQTNSHHMISSCEQFQKPIHHISNKKNNSKSNHINSKKKKSSSMMSSKKISNNNIGVSIPLKENMAYNIDSVIFDDENEEEEEEEEEEFEFENKDEINEQAHSAKDDKESSSESSFLMKEVIELTIRLNNVSNQVNEEKEKRMEIESKLEQTVKELTETQEQLSRVSSPASSPPTKEPTSKSIHSSYTTSPDLSLTPTDSKLVQSFGEIGGMNQSKNENFSDMDSQHDYGLTTHDDVEKTIQKEAEGDDGTVYKVLEEELRLFNERQLKEQFLSAGTKAGGREGNHCQQHQDDDQSTWSHLQEFQPLQSQKSIDQHQDRSNQEPEPAVRTLFPHSSHPSSHQYEDLDMVNTRDIRAPQNDEKDSEMSYIRHMQPQQQPRHPFQNIPQIPRQQFSNIQTPLLPESEAPTIYQQRDVPPIAPSTVPSHPLAAVVAMRMPSPAPLLTTYQTPTAPHLTPTANSPTTATPTRHMKSPVIGEWVAPSPLTKVISGTDWVAH